MRALQSVLAAAAAAAVAGANLNVWPLPASFSVADPDAVLSVPASFKLSCGGACPAPLPAALARYSSKLLFAAGPATATATSTLLTGCTVTAAADAPMRTGVDESYTLKISAPDCVLSAPTQWGAMHGLERLSQLITWQGGWSNGTQYTVAGNGISIADAPRFPWRGMLIDSSRNFLTVGTIKHTLDAMSYNAFNTLHWHLTDDQSWPLYSETYPRFTEAGAYAPSATYSHADVRSIVAYAWERGIKVVPEFDMPAHATIWGAAYPNLTIACPGHEELLNPTGPVYPVFEGLMAEFAPLFNTTDYIHVGGDEVLSYACWEDSPEVGAWMAAEGLHNMSQAREYFQNRIFAIVDKHARAPVVWEEVFYQNFTLEKNVVINAWDGARTIGNAITAGYQVVSAYNMYLDQQTPPGPTHYLFEDTWQNFYGYEPFAGTNFSPAQEKLLIGMAQAMWGEQVDATDIDARIWPRALGGAERFWSPASVNDITEAAFRLSQQRCRMVQRGVGAGPIRPASDYGYCFLPPGSRFGSFAEM